MKRINTLWIVLGIIILIVLIYFIWPNEKKDYNIGQLNLDCDIDEPAWKTGVASVPEYSRYQAKVLNLEKTLNCTCSKQNCHYCRIDGLSWYTFYYLGDKFIVTHQWDENNNALIEAFEYSLEGKKGALLCAQTFVRDSPETCPIIRANENKRVDIDTSKSYYDLRKEIVKKLSGINRIENILFDIYVESGVLNPENNISDIYIISNRCSIGS